MDSFVFSKTQLDEFEDAGFCCVAATSAGLKDTGVTAALSEFVLACVVFGCILFEHLFDEGVFGVLDARFECGFGFLLALDFLKVNEFSHKSAACCKFLGTVVCEDDFLLFALFAVNVLADLNVVLIGSH